MPLTLANNQLLPSNRSVTVSCRRERESYNHSYVTCICNARFNQSMNLLLILAHIYLSHVALNFEARENHSESSHKIAIRLFSKQTVYILGKVLDIIKIHKSQVSASAATHLRQLMNILLSALWSNLFFYATVKVAKLIIFTTLQNNLVQRLTQNKWGNMCLNPLGRGVLRSSKFNTSYV